MLITLRQIEIFLAIIQEKSIAVAAEKLYLSKPAISMALTELESKLNHQLFDRIKNRLILNYYGQQLLAKADEIYQRGLEIEQLFSSGFKTLSNGKGKLFGKLSVGTSNTVGNYLLPNILYKFREITKNKQQQITIDNSENICKMVADYQLDIGIVEAELKNEDLEFEFWQTDRMCVIAPQNHKLVMGTALNIADLENTNWILRELGSGSRSEFMKHIMPFLQNWHIALELNTTESIINSVQAGLGLAVVSKLAAKTAVIAKQVKILDLAINDQMIRKLWIVSHKNKYHSPLVTAFIASLQD